MRILIVTQYFWPENFRINDLAAGLAERGHIVEVLTGKPNYPGGRLFSGYGALNPKTDSYKHIPVRRVPPIPRFRGRGWQLALNYLSFAISASLIGPLLCRRKFDAIFVFGPSPITVGLPAMVLKKIHGTPILFWVQDLWPESLTATGAISSKRILSGVSAFVRMLYRHCDRILIQSEAFKEPVLALDVPPEKITYYPNSAEPLYHPVKLRKDAAERAMVPDGFVVMFAGNIGAVQDFETILEAAKELRAYKDTHFVIIGDGRRFDWLKTQVDRRGLEDTFHLLGRHPMETMPRFFALADALLVTLRKDPIFELTIPSKLQSYMACGRPVIAGLDGEGARVVTISGGGVAAPAEDSAELAQAIKKLYEMPADQRSQMGAKGLKYFQANIEREMLLDRLETIMAETVKEVAG